MPRIRRYEFKKTKTGLKVIAWQQLERGGQSAVVSAEMSGNATPADLMQLPEIKATTSDARKARAI